MTPTEFYDAQARLGLGNDDAARLLGLETRTIRHYVAGSRAIPEPVSRLLRLMLAMHLTAPQVLALLRAEREARVSRGAAALSPPPLRRRGRPRAVPRDGPPVSRDPLS